MDPLNRSHPEWRIGEDPACGGSAMTGGRGLRAQLDHARPEVRQRMVDVVDELLGSYQVEGLELDFERRPHFFKPSEAVANRHLMTDMLRKIRAAAQRAGEASGKPVEVICRVWMDLSDCWNLGLDVRTWVEEGLIDILVSTNHIYFSLDNRLEEYVDLAKGTPVKVFMSYCPVLNGLGPGMDSGSVPTAAGQPVDTRWVPYVLTKETWYAAAQMAFAKGATGLASFNFSMIARAGAKWDRSILSELADPTFVARQNKLYPFITGESLNRPQRLGRDLVSYQLYVADDPAAVSKMMLEVYVTQTTTKDRIAFSINGQNLSMTRRLTRPDVTGGLQAPEVDPRHFFECELKPGQIEKGPNELSVQLTERNPEVSSPLTVVGVNIRVECES